MNVIENPVHLNIFSRFTSDFSEWCRKEITYLTNGNTVVAGIIAAVAAVIVGIALVYFAGTPGIIFGVVSALVLTGIAIWLIHDGRRKEKHKVLAAIIHKLHDLINKLLKPVEEFLGGENQSVQKIGTEEISDPKIISENNDETDHKKTIEKINDVLKTFGPSDPHVQKILESTEKFIKSEKMEPHDQKNTLKKIGKSINETLIKLGNISKRHHEHANEFFKKLI